MPADADPVLRALVEANHSAAAPAVDALQLIRHAVVPALEGIQQRYVRVPFAVSAIPFDGPVALVAPLAPSGSCRVQVRLTWQSTMPLGFQALVKAVAVDEKELPNMATWLPPRPGEPGDKALQHNVQERAVTLMAHPPTTCPVTGWEYTHSACETLSFTSLSFGHPSNMRPRWLVFATTLLDGGLAYVLFKLPTVAERLTREPTGEDLVHLAGMAGFQAHDGAADGEFPSLGAAAAADVHAFIDWLQQCLLTIRFVKVHFERTCPQVICGWAVNRERAVETLAPYPPGVFLLRFGRSPRAIVLSARETMMGGVVHCELTRKELQAGAVAVAAQSLDVLLAQNAGATKHLLDIRTGELHQREKVLGGGYIAACDLIGEVRKRFREDEERKRSGSREEEGPSYWTPRADNVSMATMHSSQQPTPQQPEASTSRPPSVHSLVAAGQVPWPATAAAAAAAAAQQQQQHASAAAPRRQQMALFASRQQQYLQQQAVLAMDTFLSVEGSVEMVASPERSASAAPAGPPRAWAAGGLGGGGFEAALSMRRSLGSGGEGSQQMSVGAPETLPPAPAPPGQPSFVFGSGAPPPPPTFFGGSVTAALLGGGQLLAAPELPWGAATAAQDAAAQSARLNWIPSNGEATCTGERRAAREGALAVMAVWRTGGMGQAAARSDARAVFASALPHRRGPQLISRLGPPMWLAAAVVARPEAAFPPRSPV
eukprot:scaffold10.g2304.t1